MSKPVRPEWNFSNALIVDWGLTLVRILALLWREFPDLAAHDVFAYRAAGFPATHNVRQAVFAELDQICYQHRLLVEIERIPRLGNTSASSEIEKSISSNVSWLTSLTAFN
ncbi:hypothetical protein [Paraburkholderia unamae]|uniref:hypothetical protein n=1 Tax=Paraburkholderia unamae TaxID=219649 RepID=UPI001CC6692F|nr:hypothetical protein [Paraburkholderia unamae]